MATTIDMIFMHFTIITPSFNQLGYLKRCIASVRDQVGSRSESVDGCSLMVDRKDLKTRPGGPISVHHHVQDGGSTDGTREFLAEIEANSYQLKASGYSFSFTSTQDSGMYDALNKGIQLALNSVNGNLLIANRKCVSNSQSLMMNACDNSVVAWLNCDEQYLPGTLQKVESFFCAHPSVDILFGGMLMVESEGHLLSCRKAMPMRRMFLEASYLYNFSCAMFFRASLWQRLGGFDSSFKNAGDEEWMLRALRQGAGSRVLGDYLATFTYTVSNLSSGGSALEEHTALKRSASVTSRVFKLPINLLRLSEKFIRGGHRQQSPVEYEIYAGDGVTRTRFRREKPSCKWPNESRPYLTSHRLK